MSDSPQDPSGVTPSASVPHDKARDASPLSDLGQGDAAVAWAMVDASPDALVMADESGRIELVNRQCEALFGYDRGELLGRSVEELLPESLRRVHRAHRTRYRVTPEVRSMGSGMELAARRRDGSEFPVEISLSPLTLDGALHVIAAVRDITDRVAKEAEARRIRHTMESLLDGIYMFDRDSLRFSYVNEGAAGQSGYSVEDLTSGMTPLHLAPDFTRSEFEELVGSLGFGPSEALNFETTLRDRSGTDHPVDVVMECPDVDDGQRQLVVAVVRDISDRVASEERQRLVQRSIDAVSDAVFMCDPETLEFTYVNQGASAMHGYSRDELLSGMTPADLAPALPREQIEAALRHLATHPEAEVRLTAEARTKQGTALPVDVVINWPEAPTGAQRPIMAVVRDISAQVAGEAAVRASEARFRAAFGEGPVPMTIIEVSPPDRRDMIDVNDALAELFGYTREELIGRPAADLIHSDDVHPDATEALQVAAGLDAKYENLVRGVRADGSVIWLRRYISALDPDGDQNQLIVHVVDVTAELRAEAARRSAEGLVRGLSQVRAAMLRGATRAEGLELVCEQAHTASDSVGAMIITPTGEGDAMRIEASSGIPDEIRARLSYRTSVGLVGETFRSGTARHTLEAVSDDTPAAIKEVVDENGVGPMLIAPLQSGGAPLGVLLVVRLAGAAPYTDADHEPIERFAEGAASAIQLAEVREAESRVEMLEDRERIGRDMHDMVIGRLFATGMTLQSAATLTRDGPVLDRLSGAVGDIDAAITEIRTAVYGIRSQPDWGRGIRGDILAVAADHRDLLGFEPTVDLVGPIDELPREIYQELEATLREALSNAAKYARATKVSVSVAVDAGQASLRVVDNGVGFDVGVPHEDGEGSFTHNGLGNMATRAERLGGAVTIASEPGDGTTISWAVPLR